MVRRLLLTAFLATLAVALPAAAEEDPLAGLPLESVDVGCLPDDLACGVIAPMDDGCDFWDGCVADPWGGLEPLMEDVECDVWDVHTPSSNQPVTDMVVLDPDGCVRSFIRRTLGWPPMQIAIESAPEPLVQRVLGWP